MAKDIKIPTTVAARIKFIKQCLGKPYHLFYYTQSNRVIFRVEDKHGSFLYWEGAYMAEAVDNGLEYVKNEIEMGTVKTPEREPKESKKK